MLEQVLRELKNYFITEVWVGNFSIEDKSLVDIDFLKENQYYRISGSLFNDGIHKYPSDELVDEDFNGEIWALAIPNAVISLVDDINAWMKKYGDVMNSPYDSESFGGYSYSKAQGFASTGGGMLSSWQSIFARRLNQWRKVRYEPSIRRNDYVRNTE